MPLGNGSSSSASTFATAGLIYPLLLGGVQHGFGKVLAPCCLWAAGMAQFRVGRPDVGSEMGATWPEELLRTKRRGDADEAMAPKTAPQYPPWQVSRGLRWLDISNVT